MDDLGAAPDIAADPTAEVSQRGLALARWRRRSQVVQFYRRALPAAMAALVVFGLGWVLIRSLLAMGSGGDAVGTIHLLHPTFYGRNERGERYVLAAEQAVRDGADPDHISLVQPKLWEYTSAPQPETVVARTGVYHEKDKLLDLFGHARANDGQGNTFISDVAYVNMRKNSVVGRSRAFGYGPQGTISASSYAVYDKGQHVIFTGDVHTHLVNNPTSKAGAGKSSVKAPPR